MIVRIFNTAVDPGDVDHGIELFKQQVRPAFERFAGCAGIEMLLGVEEHSGNLVSVAAVSRWDSLESIQKAVASDEYAEALREIVKLFEQTPLIHHYRLVD